jgi:predicted dehydrogenase
MSDQPANPLFEHPAFAPAAKEIGRGALGQRLSAYVSGRAKRRDADPLLDPGASLLDFLLTVLGGEVESVMATSERVQGKTTDAWFITLRFADGLIATLDLGNFLPGSYPVDLELRLEFCGTDHVIVVEPANVAVTVIGPDGLRRDEAYPEQYHERLSRYAEALQSGHVASPASKVIEAVRRSAAAGEVTVVW